MFGHRGAALLRGRQVEHLRSNVWTKKKNVKELGHPCAGDTGKQHETRLRFDALFFVALEGATCVLCAYQLIRTGNPVQVRRWTWTGIIGAEIVMYLLRDGGVS